MKTAKQLVIVCMLTLVVNGAFAATVFTDWISADTTTEVAQGMLGTTGVTLTGTDISSANTDETSLAFSSPQFTPSLVMTDHVEIVSYAVLPVSTYEIVFSQSISNPLLHIGSLASVLTFSGVNPERISGDSNFLVSTNTVTGLIGVNDSNGTIRLPGVFSSITFSANFVGFVPGSADGILFQVGMEAPIPSIPEPSNLVLFAAGALILTAARVGKR